MKILAISDKESTTLLNWVEHKSPDLRSVDLIIACGDLLPSYMEYVSNTLGKDVIYVRGNHDQKTSLGVEEFSAPFFHGPVYEDKFGGLRDLHGRLFYYKDWVFVGFEGSLWYNGEGTQYYEEEMHRIVRHVENKLRLRKLSDWVRGSARKLIVISHAPLAGIHDGKDLCHRGFQCFHHFLHTFSPILWIHGHTATEALSHNQVSKSVNTTILNAYEYKFIKIQEGEPPFISFNPSILQEHAIL
jgi:Icc-related predicted phosphoesterase